MHPAAVVRLHLQCIDEGIDDVVLLKVVRISAVSVLTDHVHYLVSHRCWIFDGTSRSLDVGKDLWIVLVVGDPSNLGALHGIPEADSLEVVAPGLAVICQRFGKRPCADFLDRDCRESKEGSQVVISLVGFGGDGRSSAH